jgi:hypothetical protein
MAEEKEVQETSNDGTWSGLKKTIIGTISTAVLAGGTWVTTHFLGGNSEPKEEHKTEQVAPVINLNVDNSSKNSNSGSGGTTTIIHEKEVVKEKSADKPVEKKEEDHKNDPW